MKFVKRIFLPVGLIFVGALASCVDNAAVNEEEIEQIRLDSIAQADVENGLIDAYIADPTNGIDASQVVVDDYGVRRIVWAPETSVRVPEFNDIVSVPYTGKFLDNDIFDTNNASVAKLSDSLDYVEDGLSFDDLLAASEKSYEDILDSLNSSDGAIDDPLFTLSRVYLPMVFNHQENGSGISFNFILGFRLGLTDVMLDMELDSKALIMIPSAVAYGTLGTLNADGSVGVPPNTPLLFEFSLVNIRP